jgi:hypothetical protein
MKITLLASGALVAAIATAAAETVEAPPWNISGDWTCVKNCIAIEPRATRVIQNGNQFRFIDEAGLTGSGEWKYDFFIAFLGCDNVANLSADLRTLTFGFGPVWAR